MAQTPNWDPPNTNTPTAKTTVTSFRVIEALLQHKTSGVSELAAEVDLAKGTVHKHLNTLRQLGYVVKDGTTYRLSLSFLRIGTTIRAAIPLYSISQAPLESLAEATNEVASIVVPENDWGIYLSRVQMDEERVLGIQEGERIPLHATAGGKAILAYMPEAERDRILEKRGLHAITDKTITDAEKLKKELQYIYDKRSATDRGEHRIDRHCIATPIVDADGRAMGAVTLSGPAERMAQKVEEYDIPSIVSSTANNIQTQFSRSVNSAQQ